MTSAVKNKKTGTYNSFIDLRDKVLKSYACHVPEVVSLFRSMLTLCFVFRRRSGLLIQAATQVFV